MKRGFTLIEMLVVVVVLVTLMGIVFRLGSIGGESRARTVTVQRLQRLEYAVSGYYAAFGTYPPVKIHGSRNPYLKVSDHGVQNRKGQENTSIWGWVNGDGTAVADRTAESEAWRQVEPACRSQPVACEFPFPEGDAYKRLVESASESLKTFAENSDTSSKQRQAMAMAGFDDGVSQNKGRFSAYTDKTEWEDLQLFRFGLLSYLLPRYVIMMNGDETFFKNYAQWTGNNILPCNPMTGARFSSWGEIWKKVEDYWKNADSKSLVYVANIPSQAACSRWIACFEKALCCNHSTHVFGLDIRDKDGLGQDTGCLPRWNDSETGGDLSGNIYSPGGFDNDTTSGQYILDCITMRDGWYNDLYYYSPAPHQSYVIWSAGPNGRTFPPWISRDGMGADANRCIAYWTRDDIVNMSK